MVLLGMILSGCSGSAKTAYYTLGAGVQPQVNAAAVQPGMAIPSLGVGPVRIPTLLDRQGVVLRKDEYTVEVSELAEWGGEMEDQFVQALADRLQAYLPQTRVRTVPWELEQTPQYQLSATVTQFDGIPGQRAWLRGRWQWQLAADGKGVRSGSFDLQRPVSGEGIPGLVRAQSQLVDDLALNVLQGLK
ncbi:MAG: PqiC family protein [Thiolinea sp.]